MYLKRLDLQGFKSFPDKIKLEFQQGVTAIVGPNGSGKSNVSDAVRWVLGEQKARSLRGDKMEDVIFAGTEARKPLGFAEVSITIDNVQHEMPIDFTEVTVTRRVFRSGESEYLINGIGCRLKDIHELFMDTGVGKEGYSIIGQGRIDEILSTKSEDRRKIFEEAAGIVKYKTRKSEAIVRLEKEQQNLCRIEDIISELEGQIDPLQEQSDIAKQYLSLREQLKKIEVAAFCTSVDKIEVEIERLDNNIRISQENVDSLLQESQKRKEEIISIRKHAGALSEDIQVLSDNIITARTEIEKKEGTIRVIQQQVHYEEESQKRLKGETEQKNRKCTDLQKELRLLETKLSANQMQTTAKQEKMSALERELASLNNTLEKNTTDVDNYQEEILQQIHISTELKSQISQNEVLVHQLSQRQEQADEEIDYQKAQIHAKATHISAVLKQLADIQKSEQQLLLEKKELEQKRFDCLNQIESMEKRKKELENQINQKQSRIALLCEMEQEHEGFLKSVKSILKLRQQDKTNWTGIHGVVGELLQVDKKYETAIEIALGSAVQNIVTETEEDAKKAIQYLKEYHLGRGTFLPISSIKGKTLNFEKDAILEENSVLGAASKLVTYAPIYEEIFASLLGRIVVVEDIDTAIRLAKKYHYRYKIVTLDGDVLNSGGSMTGGSNTKKMGNIFGRSREIQVLKSEIEFLESDSDKIGNEFHELELCLDDLEQQHIKTNLELQKITMAMQTLQEEQKKDIIAQQGLKERLQQYIEDGEVIANQIADSKDKLKCHTEKLIKIENKMKEMNQFLHEQQSTMLDEKKHKDNLLEQITAFKVELSVDLQDKKNLQENMERFKDDIYDIVRQMHESKQQEEISLKKTKELQKSIIQIKNEMEILEDKNLEHQQILTDLTEKRKNLFETVSQLEEISIEKMETISQMKNEIFRLQTKIEKMEEDKHRLYQELWDEYEMTYQGAKEFAEGQILESGYKQQLLKLKSQLKNLGNVNINAIEQYKTIKERYQFLTKQRQDIVDAKVQLTQMMKELSLLMEEQFKKQFAVISENFNDVFREIFEGGKAYLRLEDSDNVLESPIEIIAQPPGKSLQNMMLLSGGERALTAIAILFAILKMKPSPFCILDEIEAALDDANVKRYAKYLKRFSGNTQFIVITHRKGTMEAADILYGVTMQEKGISRMVSVQFDENKQYM